jgi:hypothetical protein
MSSALFENLAGEQVLHLTTVGRVTGRSRRQLVSIDSVTGGRA